VVSRETRRAGSICFSARTWQITEHPSRRHTRLYSPLPSPFNLINNCFIVYRATIFPQNVHNGARLDCKTRCCEIYREITALRITSYRAPCFFPSFFSSFFLFLFLFFFFLNTHFIVEIGKNCGCRAATLKCVLIGCPGAPYVPRTKWVTGTTWPDHNPQSLTSITN